MCASVLRAPTTAVYLVYDNRERSVVPFLESECAAYVQHARALPAGDYHLCRDGKVLACVERKTLEDFGASFKDGRYENVNKMLDLRARTGCQLYYIIEGLAFPALTHRYSRISYANILAAITHLMTRHAIMIVQTKDQMHTAQRLADIMRALNDPRVYRFPITEEKGDEPGAEGGYEPPAASLEPVAKTDDVLATEMWAELPGISIPLGKAISQQFSVAMLARGVVAEHELDNLRTATGRKLPEKAIRELKGVRMGHAAASVRLLAGVRGLSKNSAGALLQGRTLRALCEMSAEQMGELLVPHGKGTARLGARAEHVHKMLTFRAAR